MHSSPRTHKLTHAPVSSTFASNLPRTSSTLLPLSYCHNYRQRSFKPKMTETHDRIAFPWLSLPGDIRLMIFDEISGRKHRGWAQCAAVCKEWQAVLEPRNFSQLTLQATCLNELETLVIRQRHLVQHICLNINLPRYGCPACKESASMSSRRSMIARRAILRLFSILSTWPPTGRLTLELSASSPSDSQHWFKNYCFGPGHEDSRDWTRQEKVVKWHDPKHGWVDGQQVQSPDPCATLRLFSPLCLNVPQNIPVVHAVTGFCIRRQLRHELFPEVLEALWKGLPRLETIAYELWPTQRRHCQISCACGTFNPISCAVIRFCIPTSRGDLSVEIILYWIFGVKLMKPSNPHLPISNTLSISF